MTMEMWSRRWRNAFRMVTCGILIATTQQHASAQKAQPYVTPRFSEEYLREMAQLPDWNGTWQIQDGIMFDPYHAVYIPDDSTTFGTGIGTGSYLTEIPLTPEYRKKYDEFIRLSKEGKSQDPYGSCMRPHGMPRQMGGTPGGPEIIVLPGEVRMTWHHFNATRRIYTDGREHPTGDELVPSYMGHSIGRWEGDVLIVDTVGMMEGIFDQSGAPHSDQVHTVERMKMVGPDLLYVEVTVTDPLAFIEPWVVTRKYQRVRRTLDSEGIYCEGTRLDMSRGYQRDTLPSDEEEMEGQDRK